MKVPDARHKHDAWRAKARYVDHDNNVGEVSRRARTRDEAIAAVEQALRERMREDGATVEAGTPLVVACERWLTNSERSDSGRSPSTVAAYRGAYERTIAGIRRDHRGKEVARVRTALSAVTLAQANDVQRLERFLRETADTRGTASAKHARAVLSGVLQDAVRTGVLATNAMRSVGRVKSQRQAAEATEGTRDTTRAFTDAERANVLALADTWAVALDDMHPGTAALRRSVADLARLLMGTGMRVGEALSLRWEHLDLETGRTDVPGTKSAAARRRITLPGWLLDYMRSRAEATGTTGYVLSAPRLSDPERKWEAVNCSHAITKFLAEAGCPWARSHTFRKSLATRLGASGAPLVRIADQLGHSDPSMTASVYLGRDFMGDKSDLAAML